jgi:hypothetical protein
MGGMFSSQQSQQSQQQTTVPKKRYKYRSQNELRLMNPEDILKLNLNDVDPKIDERYGNPPLSDDQQNALEKLLNGKYAARDFDGSLMSGGKRKRKIRRRKSRKNKK